MAVAVGEWSQTIVVSVLDDAHDEGEETLTLRLWNPSGVRLADAEATGTIENTDLMPAALLAGVGAGDGRVGGRAHGGADGGPATAEAPGARGGPGAAAGTGA